MAHDIFRRGGIPVLVSLASDISLPLPCSFVAKHSAAQQQATLSLQFRISIRGFDEEQPVTLLYHADNLFANATALKTAIVSLPQALLDQVARNKGTNMRILSLQLKAPCVVRCPTSVETIAPHKAPDMRFGQVLGIARATRIYILLDHNWLHPLKIARFRQIVTNPEPLSPFIENNKLRHADWTIFDDTSATVLPPCLSPPPLYERNISSNKRPRQSVSPPTSPLPKRVLLSPARFLQLSPTEKATTTTASPSPRPHRLPDNATPNIQEAVNDALVTALPSALQAILPNILAGLLAAPPPSFSSSTSPFKPLVQHTPLAPFHHLVRTHLTAHADSLAQQITNDLLEHASELRNMTDVDLKEDLDDHRVDVAMLKEDGLRDIDRAFDEKLDAFRENAEAIVESVEEETKAVFDEARERLEGWVEGERDKLRRGWEEIERERRSRNRVCELGGRREGRAKSAPVEL